MFPAIFWWI